MKQPWSFVVTLMFSVSSLGVWPVGQASAQAQTCAGDCDHNDRVTVNELVTGVSVTLGKMSLDRCPELDPDGNDDVTVAELITAVNNSLAGCALPSNHAPRASDVSFSADVATPYVEKQLIGTDMDNDPITYELVADGVGTGYEFAYVNPDSGMLYVTLSPEFQGTISLPYHVTDGRLFSNTAQATIEVQAYIPANNTGAKSADPKEYAGYPRGFYNGNILGAPGADPTLPSWVDLSKDFPLPGDQGQQSSCVAWASAYALKSYQERVEFGWSLEPSAHRFSPAYVYNQINGGVDNGSQVYNALSLIVDQGVATLDEMPYSGRDFWTQPSAAARQEASQFKGLSWKTVNGVLEIKDALANHLPVVVVIWVYADLKGLRGPDSVYNTFGGELSGRHAVTIAGYDDNRYGGAFKVINSWGGYYGDGGYFWMPYSTANRIIYNTPWATDSILSEAYVLEDMQSTHEPVPDPVDPKPTGDLPDLQVSNWNANFNGTPGGSGSLQYTVINSGTATAKAGANVALSISPDPNFAASTSLVVYERIPFDMAPGTTAYRDANNSIAFNFPYDLAPGQYYMAFKVDIFNDVAESNEGDNFSPAQNTIDIVNTLPDMEVVSWYSVWDELGNGSLTYDVINNGASTAAAGWPIALVLSPNDIIGDGDDIFLFSEPAGFSVDPGGTIYRNDAAAANFILYFDSNGNPVPDGTYYIALWLDSNGSLAESNEFNNASLSWGTIRIGVGPQGGAQSLTEASAPSAGEAYNGKVLPEPQGPTRQVRISTTLQGRRAALLGDGAAGDAGPSVKAPDSPQWSKTARALQQVIFPVTGGTPMP